eukprot:5190873-Prymnesium_polylepis.1
MADWLGRRSLDGGGQSPEEEASDWEGASTGARATENPGLRCSTDAGTPKAGGTATAGADTAGAGAGAPAAGSGEAAGGEVGSGEVAAESGTSTGSGVVVAGKAGKPGEVAAGSAASVGWRAPQPAPVQLVACSRLQTENEALRRRTPGSDDGGRRDST